jgi:hypothetical protein
MKRLKSAFVIIILIAASPRIFAQDVKVSITTVSVSAGQNQFGDWRYQVWLDGTLRTNCIEINGGNVNEVYSASRGVVSSYSVNINSDINLQIKAWEEDSYYECNSLSACGMGNCDFNSGCPCGDDDLFNIGSGTIISGPTGVGGSTFKLYNLRPGNVSDNLITIRYGGSPNYTVTYNVTYAMPKLLIPTFTVYDEKGNPYSSQDPYVLCGSNRVDLNVSAPFNPAFGSEIEYEWYFRVNGETSSTTIPNPNYCGATPGMCPSGPNRPACCTVPPYITTTSPVWTAVPGSPSKANTQMSFSIRDLRSSSGAYDMKTITNIVSVNFMVRARANNSIGEYSDGSATVSVAPPKPQINSYTTDKSCPNGKTGMIYLNITGTGNYKYNLRPGHGNDQACVPTTENSCFSGDVSGNLTNGYKLDKPVSGGDFTIWVANKHSSGCASTENVTVPTFDVLSVGVASKEDVTCNGGNDGRITLQRGGGLAPYTISLSKTGYNASDANGVFASLQVGSYVASVTDGCGQNATTSPSTILITQPPKVTGTPSDPVPASCALPGNGEFSVVVSKSTGTYDSPKSGSYFYTLTKDGNIYNSYNNWESANATFSVKDLPVGNYQLIVSEQNACANDQYVKLFSIAAPPAMTVSNLNVVRTTCYGDDDGKITFTASGGSGQYYFELDNLLLGGTLANAQATFESLKSGSYRLKVKNNLTGCNDVYVHPSPINLDQPARIGIDWEKNDISCYGKGDGSLNAYSFSGGNGGYGGAWQELVNSKWISISSNTFIENRDKGTYRFLAEDSKQCKDSTDNIEIIEPTILEISNVAVADIRCLHEKGSITVNATGGIEDYIDGVPSYYYHYSQDNGISFTPFDKTTPLIAGNYRVKVTDRNGCEKIDAQTYMITSPPSALDFTYQLSDYKGYNISCFNGGNGEITFSPTGGNGLPYTGYSFAADARAFTPENKLIDFNAGNHQVAVRDGRGCVVTKTVNFTQAPQLTITTPLKKDVDCFGESTGELELNVVGGVGPYTYQRDALVPQDSSTFVKLSASSYSFTIRDKNDCATQYIEQIINLHPEITSVSQINDANCYHGSDGSIELLVSGGSSTVYFYELEGFGSKANPVTGLAAGAYNIIVRDSKNCKHIVENLVIDHPDSLLIEQVNDHDIVCTNGKGSIEMISSGGTEPYEYQYSINNGFTYVPFTSVTALSENEYKIRVRDSHNCITEYTQGISITNPAPLDFTYQLSDYNGFNISCFAGDNGFVIVNGTGGNGVNYSGYEFALDNAAYQTESKIEKINAGIHNVYLRDARGCVVTKEVTLTQSQEQLTASLKRTEDVSCFYHTDGLIEVTASGAVPPYKYWLTSGNKKDTPEFTGLGVGNYTVTIADVNECAVIVNATIQSVHPEFSLSFDTQNVNCFEGKDGSLSLHVTGGVSPFHYSWKGHASTDNVLENIKSGSYEVTVTDNAGCFVTTTATVKQPDEPLTIASMATHPACYDQSNGTITVEATGGTTPYQYLLTNETEKQPVNVFSRRVGNYTVLVEDNNGCTTTGAITIQQRNSRPEPNFVVALKEHALDTLVIKELSYPKPDSIEWTFDENALIVNADKWSPQILFKEAGDYMATMTAYYGDCAYIVTKKLSLSPYDPNAIPVKDPEYKAIESVDVSPNPNNGEFEVVVKLSKKYKVSILVYDVLGGVHYNTSTERTQQVNRTINIKDAAAGVYLLRVITETDARDVRIIVNK